jgi:hypothetical protein
MGDKDILILIVIVIDPDTGGLPSGEKVSVTRFSRYYSSIPVPMFFF